MTDTDFTQPLPPQAVLSMMQAMFKHQGDEYDQPPMFGFMHAPPLTMAAALAEEEGADVADVRGLLAAPMPLSAEDWDQVPHPLDIVKAYARILSEPESDSERALLDRFRNGTPVMGAWMLAEAWAPPKHLEEAYARARREGRDMDTAAMPDRREARVAWAVDAWGREYVARQIRDADEFEYDYTDPGEHHLGVTHSALPHLRNLLHAVASPIPT